MNFASSGLFFTQKSMSIRLKWIQWIKTARLRRKTNLQKSDYPKAQIKITQSPFDWQMR